MYKRQLLGCGLHTEGICPQIDRIHVVFKNPVLVVYLIFELKGKVLLLNLSLKLFYKGSFACPAGQYVVLDELLCYRAGSLTESAL